MPQLLRNAAARTNRHARFIIAAVVDCGVTRLFKMHNAGRARPAQVRLRGAVGRHEADRFVYRTRNEN